MCCKQFHCKQIGCKKYHCKTNISTENTHIQLFLQKIEKLVPIASIAGLSSRANGFVIVRTLCSSIEVCSFRFFSRFEHP